MYARHDRYLKLIYINSNADRLITRSGKNGPVTTRIGKSIIKYDIKSSNKSKISLLLIKNLLQ